ncbi:uncharacterized protein B0H18DRAFT_114125 [Fomitopsis serialis]|uniref:uncharacterized protein n=1 Tax=Fomitopsis serialis TaxID=139415 RepID=UPI002008AF12|nr:uncharacterized protein B0H18DRAFT_114125 [Neoantrodia serialis]KAH9914928.1 hypothetical protein B0H18DRAFT_114125 [Neoantrodia serialis]
MMFNIYRSTCMISTPLDAFTRAAITSFQEWLQESERTSRRDMMIWDILFAELSEYMGAQPSPHTDLDIYRKSMVSAIIVMLSFIVANGPEVNYYSPWMSQMNSRFRALCDKAFSTSPDLLLRVVVERPAEIIGYINTASLSTKVLAPLNTVICLVRCCLQFLHRSRAGKMRLIGGHHLIAASAVEFIVAGSIPRSLGTDELRKVKSGLIAPCLDELRTHGSGEDWDILANRMHLAMVAVATAYDMITQAHGASLLSDEERREIYIAARDALDAARPAFVPINNVIPCHEDRLQTFKELLEPKSNGVPTAHDDTSRAASSDTNED